MILEYDGGGYRGWQEQTNGRSIAAEVARALQTVLKEPVKLSAAGRTDAGVHARGQTANFNSAAPVDPGRLRWQLNALLPVDIVVLQVDEVPEDFDARRSATGRTYDYLILNRPSPSPFCGRFSWWISRPLDLEAMNRGARDLVGAHDFSGFTVAKEGSKRRDVKEIEIVRLEEPEGLIRIRISANAFLHHMVRLIVGTLAEIGVGKEPPSIVEEILASRDVRRAGPRAPAKGLRLERVDY